MCDPKWIQCHLKKKEKKRDLYCYFSNVKKRTRIVTRLSPSRAECLGLWALHGLPAVPGESPRPHCVSVLPWAEHECRHCHIFLLSAFRLMRASFCCLSRAIIWVHWVNFNQCTALRVWTQPHSGFVFYILLNPNTVFKQWATPGSSEWVITVLFRCHYAARIWKPEHPTTWEAQ